MPRPDLSYSASFPLCSTLELFEVEDLSVVRAGKPAWAFNLGSGWRSAPGLARKAPLDGMRLSLAGFATEFSEAVLAALAVLPAEGEAHGA